MLLNWLNMQLLLFDAHTISCSNTTKKIEATYNIKHARLSTSTMQPMKEIFIVVVVSGWFSKMIIVVVIMLQILIVYIMMNVMMMLFNFVLVLLCNKLQHATKWKTVKKK